MSRQFVFTASACALAACVLVATLIFSPSLPKSNQPAERPILDPDAKFNQGPDPSKRIGTAPSTITPSGVVERYYLRRYNEARKQLTILSGERAKPRPNGVVDIEQIVAHIHLIPGRRVVEIKGPRGTLVAPENNPESGSLAGGVVITIYESPEGQLVNLKPDSLDATLRLFLDQEVHFNLELGTVESDGPVHLTTARADFKGTGLSMIYNERRRRVNRLEIMQGESMRFNPKAGELLRKPSADSGTRNSKATTTDYYRATFDGKVLVHTGTADIDAGKMEILFTLENRNDREAGEKELGHRDSGRGAGIIAMSIVMDQSMIASQTRATSSTSSRITEAGTGSPASDRSMMKKSEEDVVIRWDGGLLMEPLDGLPEELAGPDDTMITLSERVKIRSARAEIITAERVDYLSSAARVRIYGDTLAPAIIESPRLGRLSALDLVIHQNTGIGRITGPGSIIATADARLAGKQAIIDGKPVVLDDAAKLPDELVLTWNEGADFKFHVKPVAAKTAPAAAENGGDKPAANNAKSNPTLNPIARLDALTDAVFHGHVKAEHPQFDLLTEQLAVTMAEPSAGKQEPQEIKATGSVNATARGSGEQAPLEITSKDLIITFTGDVKGKTQPSRMVATGDVKTKQGGRGLAAGVLDVELMETPVKAAAGANGAVVQDADKKNVSRKMTIKHVRADQLVRVTAESPRMLVTADRLEGDSITGILQLFGTAEQPARVEREDDSLTGKHITLRESDQFITVNGPGAAEYLTVGEAPKPDAPAPPAQRIKVNWATSMDFSNTTGIAHFRGQVVAGSDRGVDVTRFQSGDLTLELDPLDLKDPRQKTQGFKELLTEDSKSKPAPVAPATNEKPVPKEKAAPRNVRKMTATEKVVFEAEQWADRVGGKLGTRFRLTGPLLNFDNVTGKLVVTGAGTMQIEDYRAKEKAKAAVPAPTADAKPASPVAFVGQGVTLFLWESSLAIDANHNDVRMDKGVKMIQQPAVGSDILMQCNQLIADFQSTGGLNSWLTGKAGEPRLDNVTAAGSLVIIYQKQTVRGDQLYYTGNKQMAIISAEEGRMAELDTEQATLPARQFRWFLDKDRIVAEEPGAIRTKVGK